MSAFCHDRGRLFRAVSREISPALRESAFDIPVWPREHNERDKVGDEPTATSL
jgi:hypothetical protein